MNIRGLVGVLEESCTCNCDLVKSLCEGQSMSRRSRCYRGNRSREIVVEEEREELATVVEDHIARVCVLDVLPVFRDLEDQATRNTRRHLGDEGSDVSGEGVEELLEVAVGLNGSEVIGVFRGDLHKVSPLGRVVGMEDEGGEIVDCIQGLIDGDVANSVRGRAKLEALSQSLGTINEAVGFSGLSINRSSVG